MILDQIIVPFRGFTISFTVLCFMSISLEWVSLFTIYFPDILLYLAIYMCATLQCISGLDSVKTKETVSGWISEMDTLIPGRTASEGEAVILCSLTRKMC